MKHRHHDLKIRTVINGGSALLLAFFIFIAHHPVLRWFFTALVASIGAVAVWEYDQLVKKKGLAPAVALSVIAVVLYIFVVFFKTQGEGIYFSSFWRHAPEFMLGVIFFSCFAYYALFEHPPITNIGTTFLGVVYIAIPLGLVISIMYFFDFQMEGSHLQGSWWIIYLLVVTKSADIGGYFIGRYFGKKKLAVKLSPNKTLEGALGGLVVSIVMSLMICFLGRHYGGVFKQFSYEQAVWIGLVIGILGQIGDLAESLLKRDANVKDSNALPGVGGILDMIDSLLFTSPIVYIFLRISYA